MPVAIAVAIVWPRPTTRPPVLHEDPLPPSPPVAAPASISELQQRVAAVLERERVPGVAIALVDRDGPIWIGGVGVADTDTRAPVTADTVFRVGSITKSIVALGVMHAVEEGKLDLDAPLHLPGVVIDNAWEAEAPVTLAHCLEHTAGFDDMHFNEVFTDDEAMPPAVALAINPRSRVVRWRPGTRFSYANPGTSVAARALELATGEPFDAYLRREVLRPLGMAEADFERTPALAARLATGYVTPERVARYQPIAHRPAGALLASATDLAKLVQFWLRRDGSIVSAAGLDRIERTSTLPYPRTDVGYGLGNYGDVSQPAYGRGHSGGLPGFLSEYLYFPSLGRGYVILFNQTFSFRAVMDVRRLVFAYLARDRAMPVVAAAPAVPPGAAFFRFASPRAELVGFVERAIFGWRTTETPGGVELEPLFGDPVVAVPAGDGGYRFPGESGSSIRFTQSRDGTPIMLAHGRYAEAASWWPARVRAFLLTLAFALLQIAPVWSAVQYAVAALSRRRVIAIDLLVWPAVASLCLVAVNRLFYEASLREVLGVVHPLTIGICATTLLFAVASTAGMIAAVRWSVRADRPPLASRIIPSVTAACAFGLAVWFALNGLIGLCTWSY